MDQQNAFYPSQQKASQQLILANSVGAANLSTNLLTNAGTTITPFSITNGQTITITNTLTSNINIKNRIGAVPFQCVFFLTSATLNNLIPFGSGVTPSQWVTYGPFALPEFTPGGSDGNNLIIKTAITNNTGSTQTVLFYSDLRVIQSGKAGL